MSSTNKAYIGIDPGKNGAVAILYGDGGIDVYPMPDTARDIIDLFDEIAMMDTDKVVMLEQVGERPGQRGMFAFGRNFGNIESALLSARLPFQTVMPAKWQKAYSVGKSDNPTEHKRRLKARAQELFPTVKVTLGNADALLIAHYLKTQV